MDKIILSPSKYVQGYNTIERLEVYTSSLGKNSLIIADDFITKIIKEPVSNNYQNSSNNILFEKFNGECSKTEINRLMEIIQQNKKSPLSSSNDTALSGLFPSKNDQPGLTSPQTTRARGG